MTKQTIIQLEIMRCLTLQIGVTIAYFLGGKMINIRRKIINIWTTDTQVIAKTK